MSQSNLSRILSDAERRPPVSLYSEPRWYAAFTRSRHEKRVDGMLARRGVKTYLPLVARERQWKDRRKLVEFPLFPSYIFVRMTLSAVADVLGVPGVVAVVRARGYPTPIPDRELDNVRRFVTALGEAGVEPAPQPFLERGQWVVVAEGPFRGVRGVVVERRARARVLVGLRSIGQGFEVDLNARALRKIPPPADVSGRS